MNGGCEDIYTLLAAQGHQGNYKSSGTTDAVESTIAVHSKAR